MQLIYRMSPMSQLRWTSMFHRVQLLSVLKCIAVIAAIHFVCLASRAQELANPQIQFTGKHFALLIGVSRYDEGRLPELPGAEPDALDLAAVFASNGYGKENIIAMTHRNGAEDPRLLPTSSNIRKQLKRIVKDKKPNDKLIIALAGHGFQLAGQEYFFCPADAQLSDVNSMISILEIYSILESSDAGFKLLLIDACRENSSNGNATGHSADSPAGSQNLPNPPAGMAAFFSCSPGQLAYERTDGRKVNGVFFQSIIRGLGGAATGQDGLVTLPDLERFVKKEVESYVAKTFGSAQHPVIRNNTVGLVPLLAQSASEKKIKQASELWLRSRHQEARAIIDTILADHPNDPLAVAERARMLCDDAESRGDTSQADEMLRLANKAVELAPHRIEPLLARANIHRVLETYPKALDDCQSAMRVDSKNAFAYLYRAAIYRQTDQTELMKQDIATIREIDDRHPLIESVLAGLLFTVDEFDEAFERLDEAIELTPDIPLLQVIKGYGYDQLGNYDKAILAYTAAIRLDNQDDEIYARRAVSLSRAGDYLGAIDDVKAVERINPKRSDLSMIKEFVLHRDRSPAPRSTSLKNPSPTASAPDSQPRKSETKSKTTNKAISTPSGSTSQILANPNRD